VIILGGEPFLRKDLVEICQYIKEKCHIKFLTIITKGCIEKDLYLTVLPFIDELNISVDGYNESVNLNEFIDFHPNSPRYT